MANYTNWAIDKVKSAISFKVNPLSFASVGFSKILMQKFTTNQNNHNLK